MLLLYWVCRPEILLIVVVCRTIYLHCQICWNLHVSRIPLIVLNIIGWAIPAIFLCVAYGVAQITYTIGNHCSIRVDWIVNLLIIPIIIEIGCSIVVQFATFVYCVNVYMRSLGEPTPPTNDSIPDSTYSAGSRYPYRKAMARVNKVLIENICTDLQAFKLQWRAWAQCFSLIWTGTLFSTAYLILATKYVDLQKSLLPGTTPDQGILLWVVCIVRILVRWSDVLVTKSWRCRCMRSESDIHPQPNTNGRGGIQSLCKFNSIQELTIDLLGVGIPYFPTSIFLYGVGQINPSHMQSYLPPQSISLFFFFHRQIRLPYPPAYSLQRIHRTQNKTSWTTSIPIRKSSPSPNGNWFALPPPISPWWSKCYLATTSETW